jgi:hypothetical protein
VISVSRQESATAAGAATSGSAPAGHDPLLTTHGPRRADGPAGGAGNPKFEIRNPKWAGGCFTPVHLDLEAVDHLVQSGRAQLEQLRRPPLHAAGLAHGLADQPGLVGRRPGGSRRRPAGCPAPPPRRRPRCAPPGAARRPRSCRRGSARPRARPRSRARGRCPARVAASASIASPPRTPARSRGSPPRRAQEVGDQQRDVLAPLAQGRQLDGDDVEPVVEVLAESPLLHLRPQVGVGGRHQPHVDRTGLDAADPADLALLDHPQQLGLDVGRDGADLVEEEVPSWAASNRPLRLLTAPVKAPLTWPKRVDSRSSLGMALVWTGTKGPSPRGLRRWMARATSSLPVPDSPVTGCWSAPAPPAGPARRPPHAAAPADDLAHALEAAPQLQVLDLSRAPLGRPPHEVQHLLVLERLGHVVEGALAHGLDRRLDRRVGGDHHHRQVRVEDLDLRQQLEPGAVRQHEVEQDDVELLVAQQLHAGGGRGRL